MYVLDAQGNEAPIGGLGELCIGGDTLARGYLGRAALTAEKFVPDPYRDDGARLYRSGDLCRRREEGSIDFLGRLDQQVKLRGFRIELGEIESVLRQVQGVDAAVVALRVDVVSEEGQSSTGQTAGAASTADKQRRLVAYITGTADEAALRQAVAAKLPAYMAPAMYVRLERLPLMPNGKVDRAALPAPAVSTNESAQVAPSSDAETLLLAIWREVLGREDIGVTDNFFEVGGDSILSLRIIARAAQAGLVLAPREFFEHPDVRQLAALARAPAAAASTPAGTAETHEPLPLTPIQRVFFDRYPDGESHWNQSVLLKVGHGFDPVAGEQTLRSMLARHDALRLRFFRSDGVWRQRVAAAAADVASNVAPNVAADLAAAASTDASAFTLPVYDLRGRADGHAAMRLAADQLQRSLDIRHGPLLAAAFFRLDDGDRLLIGIHHLAVDGVSWRILFDELQGTAGTDRPLPWSAWVEAVTAYAATDAVKEEADWWSTQLHDAAIPPALQRMHERVPSHAVRAQTRLDAGATTRLLREAPRAWRLKPDELLLTALARVLSRHTGDPDLLVAVEGHGRAAPGLDTSRTVGWFTTRYPILLRSLEDAAVEGRSPALHPVDVKEAMRSVPFAGLHWGLLRYGSDPAVAAALAALPRPAVGFNYLGRFDEALDAKGPFTFAGRAESAWTGRAMADEGGLPYAVEVNAMVAEQELVVDWKFDPAAPLALHADTLAAALGDEVAALVAECANALPRPSATDFPLAGLDQRALTALDLPLADIQDIYPATPLQAGLLYRGLTQDVPGLYVIQKRLDLSGHFDPTAMAAAWRGAVARHDILRTRFEWRHGGAPLQIVLKQADLEITERDLRGVPASARDAAVAAWLRDDLSRGFDFSQAPLQRVTHFTLDETRHVLVWTSHHLLTDGWSSAQLLSEVTHCYRTLVSGHEWRPAPAAPYRDYVAWLARQPDAEPWWRGRLARVDEAAGLDALGLWRQVSTGRAAQDGGTGGTGEQAAAAHQAGSRTLKLDAPRSAGLARAARRHRVTLNTLVQAAWALVLARGGNRRQCGFGVTVSGRPAELPGMESMIGLFINSLPLWLDVPPDMRLSAWLASVQQANSELRQYEYTDLAQVKKWSGAGGNGGDPFDSLVVFENYPLDQTLRQSLPGLKLEAYEAEERTHYPLVLTASLDAQEPPRLRLDWKWDGARLDEAAVQGLAELHAAMLDALCVETDPCLGTLFATRRDAGFPAATIAAPVIEAAPRGATALLHRRIEAQAALRPDAPALVLGETRLTYGDLNQRANVLAHRLIAEGVGPESRIGLAAGRSIEMVIGLLAILKAGGAYVPLDPEYPADRLRYMIEDSGATLLLAQAGAVARLAPPASLRVLLLDEISAAAAATPLAGSAATHDPDVVVLPENLAYIIYTSGSTGRPKGTLLTHRNVSRLLDTAWPLFEFSADDTWTLFHSYAFDFSVWELFGALCEGARLVIVPHMISRSPEDFLALLRRERVTVLNQTPSAFLQLLATPSLAHADDLALRVVIFGGEALDPASLAPWVERYGDERPQLVNMYGITETTVHVTFRRIVAADVNSGAVSSPLGRPLPDLGLRVLDLDGHPAAPGFAGELHVSGAGLARGYLGKPALTADRFIPDPDDAQGGRLYRTGDLARRDAAGQLQYLGRIDNQVKIRGFRIEPGEIQARLAALPGVREALVIASRDGGTTRLLAYATPRGDAALDGGALRDALARDLPGHMVPAAVTVVAAFPLNANGKIDRQALPAPEFQVAAWEAPRPGVEASIAEVWRAALGSGDVGRHDNFFALGGDSILSLQILARLHKRGIAATPRQLFEAPTVAALAAAIAQAEQSPEQTPEQAQVHGKDGGLAPVRTDGTRGQLGKAEVDPRYPLSGLSVRERIRLGLDADQVQDIYPATPLQNGMLFHSLLQAGEGVYIDQNRFVFGGELDLDAMAAAWRNAIARHDILRTCFTWAHGGDALQVVMREAPLPLTVHDWRHLDLDEYEAQQDAWRAQDLDAGFDVGAAPLLRVALFQRPDGRYDCISTNHHVLLDGWSYAQLVGEVMHAYEAARDGVAPRLPAAGAYRAYIDWLGRQPAPQAWWQARHAEVDEPATLGTSLLPAVATAAYASADLHHHVQELDEVATQTLEQAARRHQVTLNTMVQGAWALLLARYGNRRQAAFGVTVSGRPSDLPDMESVLGLFINSLPLWADVGGEQAVGAWLRNVQGRNGALREVGHASVSQLQQWTGLSGEALFDTLVVFENYPVDRGLRSGQHGLRLDKLQVTERTHYPMVLVAVPGSKFRLRWKYDSRRLGDALVARLAGDFLSLLNQLAVADGTAPLDAVRVARAIAHGERAAHAYEPAVDRILARAALQAKAPALHCEGQALDYGMLARNAEAIALGLLRAGVDQEERVGLCVRRSVGMVAGLLGIWRAGAAFVPLDPDYPADRLTHMLDDSGVRRVIADPDTARELAALFAEREVLVVRADGVMDDGPSATAQGAPGEAAHARDGATRGGNEGAGKAKFPPLHPDQLAYVIYTSGSTGLPKGVAISQRALSLHLDDFIHTHAISAADKQLQSSTINFDVALHEMLPALIQGGQVELRGPQLWDLARTSACLADRKVTFSRLPTAYWQQWLRQPPAPETVAGLRQITVGGEGLPGDALPAVARGPARAYPPGQSVWSDRDDRGVHVPSDDGRGLRAGHRRHRRGVSLTQCVRAGCAGQRSTDRRPRRAVHRRRHPGAWVPGAGGVDGREVRPRSLP
ncbi:hypothetical protein ASB57_06630 [Bordetella sp. N]|nr:hypothetical protein ASB57_06630 [Bordetella sp. N]